MKYVWNGTTKLRNIATYLARELDVPEAAIEITFRWPSKKSGKLETVPEDQLGADLTDLRTVWETR